LVADATVNFAGAQVKGASNRRSEAFKLIEDAKIWFPPEVNKSGAIMKGIAFSNTIGGVLAAAAVSASVICCAAQEAKISADGPQSSNSSLYLKVQLDHPVKLSKLKPGDTVEGKLARDVYSSDRELFSAGAPVRMTVDHLEKRRRPADDHWPWVVKAFAPRHQSYPVFTRASVAAGSGESELAVSVLSISRKREVQAQARKNKKGDQSGKSETDATGPVEVSKSGGVYGSGKLAAPVMVLEAFPEGGKESAGTAREDSSPEGSDVAVLETLPAGTACRLLLLGDVSASKNKAGDVVQARLLEPVFENSRVALPAGTLFEGKVVKKTPPRWGSRAGSLYLTFTGVTLPGGNLIPLSASLTGAELDRRSHTRIDPEGQLRGERPGKAWMAINIGVTAGLAKEVDDTTQLIIEAIVSSATDASTAGTARIVSSAISGIYMVSRHGRDVVLPRFTEMNISLDRPLTVTKNPEATASVIVHGN
jgi:hypothetical protein